MGATFFRFFKFVLPRLGRGMSLNKKEKPRANRG